MPGAAEPHGAGGGDGVGTGRPELQPGSLSRVGGRRKCKKHERARGEARGRRGRRGAAERRGRAERGRDGQLAGLRAAGEWAGSSRRAASRASALPDSPPPSPSSRPAAPRLLITWRLSPAPRIPGVGNGRGVTVTQAAGGSVPELARAAFCRSPSGGRSGASPAPRSSSSTVAGRAPRTLLLY
ncbi:unnamed protein product [Caretta caretta]